MRAGPSLEFLSLRFCDWALDSFSLGFLLDLGNFSACQTCVVAGGCYGRRARMYAQAGTRKMSHSRNKRGTSIEG